LGLSKIIQFPIIVFEFLFNLGFRQASQQKITHDKNLCIKTKFLLNKKFFQGFVSSCQVQNEQTQK